MREPKNGIWLKVLVVLFALTFLVGIAMAYQPGQLNVTGGIYIRAPINPLLPEFPSQSITTGPALFILPN